MGRQDNTSSSGGSSYTDPLTTKGDLLSFSTATSRLAIGTDDHVLTADASVGLGVKWAAASGGGPTTGSFALANNQTSATNITGLSLFGNTNTEPSTMTTRGFTFKLVAKEFDDALDHVYRLTVRGNEDGARATMVVTVKGKYTSSPRV